MDGKDPEPDIRDENTGEMGNLRSLLTDHMQNLYAAPEVRPSRPDTDDTEAALGSPEHMT